MPNTNLNPIGIVGTDGYTPVYQPDARWTIWSINDIFQGQAGQNKFIPKLKDYVVEPDSGSWYIVTNINEVTLIPELAPISFNNSNNILTSTALDNFRVYYDNTTKPYTLSVDSLMKIYSSTASFARIYSGTIVDQSKIISQRYDNNGNFIGFDIPLQLVAYNSHDNYAIKSIPTCNTNVDLIDGDTCTVVVYDTNGRVLSKVYCILENTTYIAQAYAEQKYVVQISMKSPFIDNTNDSIVNYPVNLPMESFNPIGVVHYNDGTKIEYPIDGDKFRLYGLDQFVSTIIGHKVPLVLSYRLSNDEAALASINSDGIYVTRPYSLIVSNPNTSYNAKLFIYPRWIDNVAGYTYVAYLMNLDRNILFDVTNKIAIAPNSPTFKPNLYGATQRLVFTLDLSKVSGIFNYFMLVQTIDITLRGPASDMSVLNIWEVNNNAPNTTSIYGTNLKATTDLATMKKLNIGNNIDTVENFISTVYRKSNPLYNPLTELQAPDPTHIQVSYGNESHIIPIENYNQDIQFTNPLVNFTNVQLLFIRNFIGTTLNLSVAEMTIRNNI